MATKKSEKRREWRRKMRVRSKLKGKIFVPRVSVFRSLKHIYAQIHDDVAHVTLASNSSLLSKTSGDKKTVAREVGLELGRRALQLGIKEVRFDRGCFLYHGRISALAEGLRESGLNL